MLASGQAEAGPGVEYVRVCDTYGSGFFYIPGTDTCLRIGGYVRSDTVANGARVSTRPAPAGLSKPWGGPQEMACGPVRADRRRPDLHHSGSELVARRGEPALRARARV
jgi:hypothetical protein